jgi:hypothetical protein
MIEYIIYIHRHTIFLGDTIRKFPQDFQNLNTKTVMERGKKKFFERS